MSDWADGVFSAPVSSGGSAVMSKLLGTASAAFNPAAAAAGIIGGMTGTTATSSSNGNKFDSSFGNSGWNVNFGSGSISSSADATKSGGLESVSQWVGIASGIVVLLVALKVIKG